MALPSIHLLVDYFDHVSFFLVINIPSVTHASNFSLDFPSGRALLSSVSRDLLPQKKTPNPRLMEGGGEDDGAEDVVVDGA